jgi:Flp pilus assembly protein TadB
VVGGQRLSQNATKEERKAAKQAQRQALAAERAQQRVALQTGDERYQPVRDQGPARRWARDHVDARRGPGEYFLPVALVVLFLGFFNLPELRIASTLLLYVLVLVVAVDSFLLQRRVKRVTAEKFGETKARGAGMYAVARSLQLRRLRLPRPQVARGQYPQ